MTTASCTRDGMDKRKVTCFLLLVVIGLACICAMLYMLFYAGPHADQEIKPGGRSALHMPSMQPPLDRALASSTVRS
jgi:hypothetical protein